jgi:hypothetical protein
MAHRPFVRLDEDALHGPESTVPAATLRAHEVQAPLRPWLSNILSYRESFEPGQEVVERVVPDGAVRLILDLGDEPALRVLGPSATPARVSLRGHVDGLALTLHAGAAEALLGVPAGEIAGAVVPMQALWPVDGEPLLNRLAGQARCAARQHPARGTNPAAPMRHARCGAARCNTRPASAGAAWQSAASGQRSHYRPRAQRQTAMPAWSVGRHRGRYGRCGRTWLAGRRQRTNRRGCGDLAQKPMNACSATLPFRWSGFPLGAVPVGRLIADARRFLDGRTGSLTVPFSALPPIPPDTGVVSNSRKQTLSRRADAFRPLRAPRSRAGRVPSRCSPAHRVRTATRARAADR